MLSSLMQSLIISKPSMWIAPRQKLGIELKNKFYRELINIKIVHLSTIPLLSIHKGQLQMEGQLSHLRMVHFNPYVPSLSFP